MSDAQRIQAGAPGFLSLRLITYVILFGITVVWMRYPTLVHSAFVVYSMITLAMIGLYLIKRWWSHKGGRDAVTFLQLAAEIACISLIIYASDTIQSQFSALYIVTIVSAALTYRLFGTLAVATLVSSAYAFVMWYGLEMPHQSIGLDSLQGMISEGDSVLYGVFLHILIFYLVAFIAGYLAERLKRQKNELDATSRALQQAQLETDDILRHLNSGLITIDSQSRVIYFNKAAERILGYREEKIRGLTCSEAFGGRMPELAECLTAGVLWRDAFPRREIEATNETGIRFPLGISTSVLTEESGEVRGVIAIFSDLTDAKQLEAKVRAADRLSAVGELSASIAHEIRNPLAAISGSVEVLSKELKLDSENERLMQVIIKESTRLNKILRDFLAYARIERPTYAKVDLCHVAGDVIRLLAHHEIFKSHVAFAFYSDEPVCYVAGDEDLLRQLLLNIATNACESFEGRHGTVTISIRRSHEKSGAEVCVEDNGPGIPEDVLKRIFQPFFSTKKQGTGLGLAIVHRIASALQIAISVESHKGRGTQFKLQFNAMGEENSRPSNEQPSSVSAASFSAIS